MSSARQLTFYALLVGLAVLACYLRYLDGKLDKYVIAPCRPRVRVQHLFPFRVLYQEFTPEATPLLRRAFLTFCASCLCAVLIIVVAVAAN